ncbi:AraC family transcriptional regulator [Massilia timonae]|uniref:HTH araC/xylS-type domain-containing protein n=1 Tax=Massilia timonae CCUG 45783 TaxID=883126 RepID=K9DPI7_9BURK|nr:hypothetical protein HMPREF9710_03864 [Massilia timonae CCUG 45783]
MIATLISPSAITTAPTKKLALSDARKAVISAISRSSAASARVGCESSFHFNRAFKRFFGRSPRQEARDVKSAFSLLPPTRIREQPDRD